MSWNVIKYTDPARVHKIASLRMFAKPVPKVLCAGMRKFSKHTPAAYLLSGAAIR